MPYTTQFFGIENVGHETSVFSLSIHLGPHTFTEDFQELPGENSLRFSLDDYDIQLDGILGYTFFSKYNACFSYGSKSMYIDVPDNVNKGFAMYRTYYKRTVVISFYSSE